MTHDHLPRPTFVRLVSENGGLERFRDDLARGVATQLQPVELSEVEGHPDRAILDRISDPVARDAYRTRLEDAERHGTDWIDPLVPFGRRVEIEDLDDGEDW